MTKRIIIGALAYLVPTFALGFVWHFVAFKGYYDALAIYRKDIIVPFGFLAMSVQALLFSWVYARAFSHWSGSKARLLGYAVFGAMLSWSFTTISVAAKNVMTSVPDYLLIESAFTLVQWLIVAPITVALLRRFEPRQSPLWGVAPET